LIDDRLLDEGGVDRLLAGLQRRQHGGQGEVLDEARDAAGVVEEGRDGVGLEGVLAGACRLEVAVEEEGDFGFVQGAEAEPDAEALGEGIVLGFAEALFEEGLPTRTRAKGLRRSKSSAVRSRRSSREASGKRCASSMRRTVRFGQAAEVGEEGGGGGALEAGGPEPAERGEVRDEAKGADGGQREGEDVVAGGIQGLGEEGEGRALAAATLGDEAGDGVAAEGEAEALEGPVEGGVAQERGLGGGLGERGVREAEVLFEGGHGVIGPLLVRSRTRCVVRASR
jgi:hypothetical protein